MDRLFFSPGRLGAFPGQFSDACEAHVPIDALMTCAARDAWSSLENMFCAAVDVPVDASAPDRGTYGVRNAGRSRSRSLSRKKTCY